MDYFDSKIGEISEILSHLAALPDKRLSDKIVGILYSQLVTALEVCLREKFRQGLQSESGFRNFVRNYPWPKKYTPGQLFENIERVVDDEINHINFQNFHECGRVYQTAFAIDFFKLPERLKKDISRILRYRHALIHQDEIWEEGRFVRISPKLLRFDIAVSRKFIQAINGEFVKKMGFASESKMTKVKVEELEDRAIRSCDGCPLGARLDDNTITCFEGAYDGLGFGLDKLVWNTPICGGMTFREAMRQRQILGKEALFGHVHLIPEGKHTVDDTKNKGSRRVKE